MRYGGAVTYPASQRNLDGLDVVVQRKGFPRHPFMIAQCAGTDQKEGVTL
jgi:hypothetical protein